MAVEPKSSGKVAVACKLPHGLVLQVYQHEPPAPAVPVGDAVTLLGANADGAVGGYGITENVDSAFYAAWMNQNKQFPAVRAGLIFAADTADKARAQAAEQARILSGFEGVNPEKPPGGVMPATDAKGNPVTPANA